MNEVTFEGWERMRSLVTEEQAKALVDILFKGEDQRFTLHGHLPENVSRAKSKGLGGQHRVELDGSHCIHVVPENIRSRCGKNGVVGGNRRVSDPRLGAGLVLAHELQHANQTLVHKPGSQFYGKPFQPYLAQAAEREARAAADDNYSLVAATLGIELPRELPPTDTTEADLEDFVDCFSDLAEVHVKDLVEELRGWGMNNPENIRKARTMLNEVGVLVTSGSRP